MGYTPSGHRGQMIRYAVAAWLAGVLAVGAAGASAAKAEMEQQWEFGVQMARRGAWKEALFRFRRTVELSPGNALLHNNLAVAFESVGDYRNADGEYRRALELDPKNERIKANYDSFQVFYGDQVDQAGGDHPQSRPQSATAPGP